jgi:hypothetical protein
VTFSISKYLACRVMVMMGTGTGFAAQLHDSGICGSVCGKSGCQSPKRMKTIKKWEGDFDGDCHPVFR